MLTAGHRRRRYKTWLAIGWLALVAGFGLFRLPGPSTAWGIDCCRCAPYNTPCHLCCAFYLWWNDWGDWPGNY